MNRDRLAEIIRLLAVGGHISLELATQDLADVVAWAQALDGRLAKLEEHRNSLLRRMHRMDLAKRRSSGARPSGSAALGAGTNRAKASVQDRPRSIQT